MFSRLNIGGPAIHVILATAGLDRARYDSLLVVGREGDREGNFFDLARAKGIEYHVIASLGREIRPLRDLITFVRLLGLMRRERPQIVHTHTAKAGVLGRLAVRMARVPVVVHTFHGSAFEGYFGPIGSAVIQCIERALAWITDAVVAVSPRIADDLIQRRIAPKRKIEVIPLGLELDLFSQTERHKGELRQELGLSPQIRLIGSVGRLVPIKDVGTLLSALAELARTDPNVALLVVGDGPERASLEAEACRLNLGPHVRFLGFRSDLERIYADLDVAVNCSLNEGTPVALIEAMAASVPVVATGVGGTPDLLEDGRLGRLVPPRDPQALAEAISHALSPEGDRTEQAQLARQSVLRRFSLERLLGDLDQLYLRLLKAKDAQPVSGLKENVPSSFQA